MSPKIQIDVRRITTDPKRKAMREKAGVDIAFFFPQGRLIVNAATPAQEEEWARRAGAYAMPGILQESVNQAYEDGYKLGIDTMLSALSRVFPGQEAEIGPKLQQALRDIQRERQREESDNE